MTVGEDFLLLATDPESGKCQLGSTVGNIALGGANLVDLLRADRVELTGTKGSVRVVLTDRTPLGNRVLDSAILGFQSTGPMRPQAAIRRLGNKAMLPIYEALEAQGEVRRRSEMAFGLFPVMRWPVFDTVARDDLARRIQASLLFGLDATERTGPLIGLLAASGKLRLVIERPELKVAKARAKMVATADWASPDVRTAIQATNAVMMITMVT